MRKEGQAIVAVFLLFVAAVLLLVKLMWIE